MAGSSEKEPVLPTHHEEHVKQKQMSRSKWGLLTLLFFTICFACLLMPWEQFKPESQAVDLTAVPQRKVALEAHIMYVRSTLDLDYRYCSSVSSRPRVMPVALSHSSS